MSWEIFYCQFEFIFSCLLQNGLRTSTTEGTTPSTEDPNAAGKF